MSDSVGKRDRRAIELRIERWLEMPMLVLGVVWLVLLIVELTRGISPALDTASNAIWIVFIVEFGLRFFIAPEKLRFMRRNWLTAISLLLPALRIFRIARILRFARGIRLARIVTSINRGMRSLGRTMGRRGFGYVLALTVMVCFAGAAGMYAFENSAEGLESYSEALWWTAMLLTTIGSEYWPKSPEGRLLTFLLSLYSLGILGYITATLASFFVERDQIAENQGGSRR